MIELEPADTAVVLVDLMPRIVALDAAPISGAEVLRRCVELAGRLRRAGALVVWVRTERPNVEAQPPGSDLAAEISPQQDDVVIVKRTLGAFHRTGLSDLLQARGVTTIVLGGLMTNFGVESTGRAADEHDYRVVFVADAMAGLHDHAHQFALDYVFPKIGTVATLADLSVQRR